MDYNTEALVQSAKSVLDAFRAGRNPTFDQLDHLEGALYPFITEKICGHILVEECECERS